MSETSLSVLDASAVLARADVEGLEYDLEAPGVGFRTFDTSSARSETAIWKEGSGLSLGDRACLALAGAVSGSAVTADRRCMPHRISECG